MSVKQISPQEAFEILKKDPNSVLIDVRTYEEFNFVGFVNAVDFNERIVLLPWQLFPQMEENPAFDDSLEESLQKLLGDKSKEATLLFLCRTGGRSHMAAFHTQNLGYENCYNILSGFEGDFNNEQQRGKVNGWKASNLPWRQK